MYGYNPYQRYIGVPQQPMVQPIQEQSPLLNGQNSMISAKSPLLSGKQVESIDVVKAMDIPMDGSVSYFPIADGSAIVSKQIQLDGTSKTTIFKPVTEAKEEVKYITPEELKKAINGIDLSEIDDIKEELKQIKKQLKKSGVKDE